MVTRGSAPPTVWRVGTGAAEVADLEDPARGQVAAWGRRAGVALLAAIVALGASGLLGVRTETVSAEKAGHRLAVTYPRVARSGLDVTWEAEVRRAGGWTGPVVLAVEGSYLDLFETQAFHPEPAASTRDGRTLYLTFDPPPSGDTFVVAYDAYIQPASQVGASARVAVMDGSAEVVGVDLTTLLVP